MILVVLELFPDDDDRDTPMKEICICIESRVVDVVDVVDDVNGRRRRRRLLVRRLC